MHLFIDTTEMVTFGLLDENFRWKEYFFDPKATVSTKLHSLIFQMLEKNEMEFLDLTSVIYCAGPGSYTGMRVAEGFAKIVEWQEIETYSFYHYEVPQMCGNKSGIWFANAFKGETFIYEWNESQSSHNLALDKNIIESLKGKKIFSLRGEFDTESWHTADLIKEKPDQTLKVIFDKKIKRNLFYYRPLNEEFKKC